MIAWPTHVHRACALFALTIWLGLPSQAHAQQTMSEVLAFLLTNRSVQTGDFARDEQAARATSETISRALLVDLATLPVSSAGGGFAYWMNPTLGTFERVSNGFGPVFSERALTTGLGQASLGVTFRSTHFDSLGGRPLRAGTLVTTANQFVDEPRPFDVETLTLDIRAQTFTAFANYGVTERFDVGAVLPIVSIHLDGERVDTYRDNALVQSVATASTVGLADLVLRAKYRLTGVNAEGLSGAAELRVPTGSKDNLLGAGRAAVKGMLIGSLERDRLGSHFNVGLVGGGVSAEFDYNLAATYAVSRRFTLVGEVVGRRLANVGGISESSLPHPSIPGIVTTRLVSEEVALHTAFAVTGFKVNLSTTWLLAAHVLLPLTDSGLRPAPSPMVALEYSLLP
jgi:hypothetical protein